MQIKGEPMKEKIETLVNERLATCPEEKHGQVIYRVHRLRVIELIAELSTLIQQEREEAYEKVLQEVKKVSKELPAEIERTNPDYRQGIHAGLDLAIDIILAQQSLDKEDK